MGRSSCQMGCTPPVSCIACGSSVSCQWQHVLYPRRKHTGRTTLGEEMKTYRYLAAAASLLTLSSAASAQQAQPVETITFQQAIDIALRQNVAIQQAENNVETARLAVTQTKNTWQPTLSFG